MQILVQDITGCPPYNEYKNAIVLLFEIECNCGKKCKKIFILEDKKSQKKRRKQGEKNENTRTN